MQRKLAAEFFGTFWLVFCGCGAAVLAAAFPDLGIGLLGVALAFGLTVVTMAYAVGGISGGHFNPAVSVGMAVGGRMPAGDLVGYVVAQVIGAMVAAAVLYLIASGKPGFEAGAADHGTKPKAKASGSAASASSTTMETQLKGVLAPSDIIDNSRPNAVNSQEKPSAM